MKTSALTIGAAAVLAQGMALATEEDNDSSSSPVPDEPVVTVYILECRGDPLSDTVIEQAERPLLDPTLPSFNSFADTPIDPAWMGNTENSELFLSILATGPKKGDKNSSFKVESEVWGYLKVNNQDICKATSFPQAGLTDPNNPFFGRFPYDRILHVDKRTVTVNCDIVSGEITYSPPSGISESEDQVGTALGMTKASMSAFAAFKVRAELEHDFRSAFTVGGELSSSAKDLIGVSGSIEADLNSLESFSVKPNPLKWEIWRIGTTWKNGQVIGTSESQLSDSPATQDD